MLMRRAKNMHDVAQILHGLRCEVSIIDAPALARMTPMAVCVTDKGFDAADAIDEWPDAAALRKPHIASPGRVRLRPTRQYRCSLHYPRPAFRSAARPLYPAPLPRSRARFKFPRQSQHNPYSAAAALAAHAHADVMMPYSGQTRPLSLFFVTVAASGDRKSIADTEATGESNAEAWPPATASRRKLCRTTRRATEFDRNLSLDQRRQSLAAIGAEPGQPLHPFLRPRSRRSRGS